MAVLAASIITRSGKAVLSRQFRELTKNRVTELLANFPSLLSENNTQHTTVEDEHVRYVYLPLDDLYIILITNRQSNILQDIDTLHLFSETITSILRTINEQEIFENAFEILSAFDEIVTLGYKENLSMLQIKAFLEMDSHEERIHEHIERNKELEATEERKRRAKEIQKKELAARHNVSSSSNYVMQLGLSQNDFSHKYQPEQSQSQISSQSYSAAPIDPTPSSKKAPRGRGLQLGKPSKKNSNIGTASEPLISNYEPQPIKMAEQPKYLDVVETPKVDDSKPVNNGILVTLEEKVTAEITREGSVVSSELKGALQLRINNPDLATCKILLSNEGSGIQFKTHPNVDRSLFSKENIIGLKNPDRPFPSNDQNLGVLRWRGVGKEDETSFVPIEFSVWLTQGKDNVDVTLEYQLREEYNEAISAIQLLVPVATENIELKSDNDSKILEISEEGVLFGLPSLSPGENGVFEFSIQASEDSLFPIEVSFENKDPVNTLGKVKVLDVVNVANDESLPFDLISELTTEGYFIV